MLGYLQYTEGNSSQNLLPSEIGEGQNHATDALSSEVKVQTQIHSNSLDINEIKAAIENGALRLYEAYAPSLHRLQGETARTDTITPAVAAIQYVDEFIRVCHKNLMPRSMVDYRSRIIGACAALPHLAMSQYTKKTAKAFWENAAVSKQTKALVRSFLGFCLARKICEGSNPFPPIEKRKKSPKAKQKQAKCPDELSFSQQDAMFEQMYPTHTGGDCGISLQLWGGFSAKIACGFNWGDLVFDPERPDYVRVKYQMNDLAGATHNFIRPVLPAGALILSARHTELAQKYSEESLEKMPIVSQLTDPTKRMSADALVQLATTKLRTIGITNADLADLREDDDRTAVSRRLLLNTYKKLIVVHCGLQDDPGSANYLQGLSLQDDVTSDHYTSFSADEAGERLYTIERSTMPQFDIPQPAEYEQCPDGSVQYNFSPDHTRQRVGVVGELTLNPGDVVTILCPHGVTGSVTARAIDSEGKPRRKSRKKTE